MTKRNWDAAKRREWAAEAKREKAMELRHESIVKQAEYERRQNEPASERQVGLIRKWKMHEHYGHNEEFLENLTKKMASEMIDQFATDHNWKKSPKTKAYHSKIKAGGKKSDTSTYQPWKSSDIKITNTKTGEITLQKNTARR